MNTVTFNNSCTVTDHIYSTGNIYRFFETAYPLKMHKITEPDFDFLFWNLGHVYLSHQNFMIFIEIIKYVNGIGCECAIRVVKIL